MLSHIKTHFVSLCSKYHSHPWQFWLLRMNKLMAIPFKQHCEWSIPIRICIMTTVNKYVWNVPQRSSIVFTSICITNTSLSPHKYAIYKSFLHSESVASGVALTNQTIAFIENGLLISSVSVQYSILICSSTVSARLNAPSVDVFCVSYNFAPLFILLSNQLGYFVGWLKAKYGCDRLYLIWFDLNMENFVNSLNVD